MKPELEEDFLRYAFKRVLYRKAHKEGLPGTLWMYQDINSIFFNLSRRGVTRKDFESGWELTSQIV